MTLGLDTLAYVSFSSCILLVTATENTARFMCNCASFISESSHLSIIDTLVKLDCDFSDTASPHFVSWPKPCPDDQGLEGSISIIPRDPFFIEYLEIIVRTNSGEG